MIVDKRRATHESALRAPHPASQDIRCFLHTHMPVLRTPAQLR